MEGIQNVATITAKELRERLAALGVEPPAADAIVRETAPLRAATRSSAARAAATEWVSEAHTEGPELLPLAVLAVLIADLFGVGGRDGVEGAATRRHPGLDRLGSGRKRAGDGGAWTGAIADAAAEIAAEIRASTGEIGTHLYFTPGKMSVLLEVRVAGEAAPRQAISLPCLNPWEETIAREGLRRSLGMHGWFGGESWPQQAPWVHFDVATPAEWGAVVNFLTERRMEDAA